MCLQYITWNNLEIKEKLECPWSSPTNETDVIECGDGKKRCNVKTDRNGWQCCANHGHLARCPKNFPLRCPHVTCQNAFPENCCEGSRCCGGLGGNYCKVHSGVSGARTCKNNQFPPITRNAYSLLFCL